jgi:hypothetical protein
MNVPAGGKADVLHVTGHSVRTDALRVHLDRTFRAGMLNAVWPLA